MLVLLWATILLQGKTLDRSDIGHKPSSHTNTVTRTRPKPTRPRPKTIHVDDGSVDISEGSSISSRGKKGSSTNLTGMFCFILFYTPLIRVNPAD